MTGFIGQALLNQKDSKEAPGLPKLEKKRSSSGDQRKEGSGKKDEVYDETFRLN